MRLLTPEQAAAWDHNRDPNEVPAFVPTMNTMQRYHRARRKVRPVLVVGIVTHVAAGAGAYLNLLHPLVWITFAALALLAMVLMLLIYRSRKAAVRKLAGEIDNQVKIIERPDAPQPQEGA